MSPAGPAVIPRVHAGEGARGEYLGHHRFCHILKTSCWMIIILDMLVQCDTSIDLNLYMSVVDLYFMVQ